MQHRQRMFADGMTLDENTIKDIDNLFIHVIEFFQASLTAFRNQKAMDRKFITESKTKFGKEALRVRDAFLERVSQNKSSAGESLTVGDIVQSIGRTFSHARNMADWQLNEKSTSRAD